MFPRLFNNYRYDGRGGMMDWYYGRMNPWQIGFMVVVGILMLALIVYSDSKDRKARTYVIPYRYDDEDLFPRCFEDTR